MNKGLVDDHLLVVGGTGFIGRWMALQGIDRGYRVTVLSRRLPEKTERIKRVRYLRADISDRVDVREALCDEIFTHVVNLCGDIDHSKLRVGGRMIIDTHLTGIFNLVENLNRPHLKSFVQVGSSDEYGDSKAPQNETCGCEPISCYSFSKFSANEFLKMLNKTEGFPVTIIRLFLVFGPYQKSNRFLPQIISSCLKNEEFPVTSGEQYRDFCYVEDVINGMYLALDSDKCFGEIINLGSGNPISIKKMISIILKKIGSGHPLFGKIPYRENENMELVADISKANSMLGWRPIISLDEGLNKTIQWLGR